MLCDFNRTFHPTKEDKIKSLEKLIQLHKDRYGRCSTCKFYIPTEPGTPGFVIDFGECLKKLPQFFDRIYGNQNRIPCDQYVENKERLEELYKVLEKVKQSCCGNCVYCDFEDYYDEETQDNISGYYCEINMPEFDYENGYCTFYK